MPPGVVQQPGGSEAASPCGAGRAGMARLWLCWRPPADAMAPRYCPRGAGPRHPRPPPHVVQRGGGLPAPGSRPGDPGSAPGAGSGATWLGPHGFISDGRPPESPRPPRRPTRSSAPAEPRGSRGSHPPRPPRQSTCPSALFLAAGNAASVSPAVSPPGRPHAEKDGRGGGPRGQEGERDGGEPRRHAR